MKTRKKRERKEPLEEELPQKEEKTKKQGKKVAAQGASPQKATRSPQKTKSPSPRKKGNSVRAKPIQLEGPQFHGPETNSAVRQSQEVLQYESINQLALANMRQMIQEGSHDQQEAAELLRGVNAANSQFVLAEVALKTSWEAEPNGEKVNAMRMHSATLGPCCRQ